MQQVPKLRSTGKCSLVTLLIERSIFDNPEEARRWVMAGQVLVNEQRIDKPGTQVPRDAVIRVRGRHRYASRGGYKLEAALEHFKVPVAGCTALDCGASTGGFTDCMLQRGAGKVYAVDVGHGQLNWKLRSDPRVIVLEKINARSLSRGHVPEPVDLCVIDVSFISLTLILPNAIDLIIPTGVILALIKPQFELQRADVGRGGIVREPDLHRKAQEKIVAFVTDSGHVVTGIVPSAIKGADGNQEFFACIRKRSA